MGFSVSDSGASDWLATSYPRRRATSVHVSTPVPASVRYSVETVTGGEMRLGCLALRDETIGRPGETNDLSPAHFCSGLRQGMLTSNVVGKTMAVSSSLAEINVQ